MKMLPHTPIKTLFLFILITGMSIMSGCKKDEEIEDPDPIEEDIIIAENTRVIDLATRDIISAIDTDEFTFTLNGNTTLTDNLSVGDIMVDSTSTMAPRGYLRKITQITEDGGEKIIHTEQATLTDAIEKGTIEFSTGLLSTKNIESMVLADGVTLQSNKDTEFTVFAFDYEHEFSSSNGTAMLSGHTDLDIEFFFNYDWSIDLLPLPTIQTDLFESGVEINQTGSILIESEAGIGIDEESIPLAEFYFTPWVFMVGPVPVVFYPHVELFVELDGSITGYFTASASESFYGKLGLQYTDDDGWDTINTNTPNSDYTAPTLTAEANFKASIGPKVGLLLYGVAGPYTDVTAYSRLHSNYYSGTGNWDLNLFIGAESAVGVEMSILGFHSDYEEVIDIFETEVLTLNNEPFGNDIFLENPIDGMAYIVGNNINITATYSGETPDSVIFNIDNVDVFTDNTEPFEYVWDTANVNEGNHTVTVKEVIGGTVIAEDSANINFQTSSWTSIDLSTLGLNDTSNCNAISFKSNTNWWMSVDGPGLGKVLATTDAGLTWQETYSSTTPLYKATMFTDTRGIFLNAFNKVMFTDDGGHSMSEMSYDPYNQPSFQWMKIYDFTTNSNNEVVAVGKDTGIPYQFGVYRANIDSHNPAGHFDLPYPNEYGIAPKIVMHDSNGVLYQVFDEDHPSNSYYMITSDGGASWNGFEFNSISSSAELKGACMPSDNKVWIVGEENNKAIVLISVDSGQTWEKIIVNDAPSFSSVYFINQDEGYATVGENSATATAKLFYTTDAGHTWDPVIAMSTTYGMSSVGFIGEELGLVVGKGATTYRYTVN